MNGGPQRGSGRPPEEDRYWVRSKGIRTMFRPQEYADLQDIAKAWGVPLATAVLRVAAFVGARWDTDGCRDYP